MPDVHRTQSFATSLGSLPGSHGLMVTGSANGDSLLDAVNLEAADNWRSKLICGGGNQRRRL